MKPSPQHPIRVLQFGEGNFLRCFVDWMIDIMNKKDVFDGKVVIIQPIKDGKVDILNNQNGKYNVYLRGTKNGIELNERYYIESVIKGINPYSDFHEMLDEIKNPDLRFIISNTTEAGIAYDPLDSIKHEPPVSFPGKLTLLLFHRFRHFNGDLNKGFILFPCELIDNNADKLKDIVLLLIDKWELGADFKNWVLKANIFCNTLVDRIVPGYPQEREQLIIDELGYEDKLAVEGEYFHSWIIEGPPEVADEFPAPKAGLNVLFVNDLSPYKIRKVRILNGIHTIITPIAYLMNIDTVYDAVNHPVIKQFVNNTIDIEIIPNLPSQVQDVINFSNDVLIRFGNPLIKHYLLKISLNSISKFEARVLPSLLEHYQKNKELPKNIVFSLSCLLLFYKGSRNGVPIELNDDEHVLSFFAKKWKELDDGIISLKKFVNETLSNTFFWKRDLTKIEGLEDSICIHIEHINKYGIEFILETLIKK